MNTLKIATRLAVLFCCDVAADQVSSFLQANTTNPVVLGIILVGTFFLEESLQENAKKLKLLLESKLNKQ